ncbi:pterin-4-alpha-carbinolamine dehydratase [Cryobacterium melibiosiphilum]|uniref:Putative pterin-4-alpha-carbinolamine dehydratase n=1 Tax=Cryobacterium melibiosiphilum TaxID=995039 RepID=A0A3A5MHC6_9MICO|nr:VOC family protein [Cryobacterium melibiosiphilum]RJT87329.1 pterin-4-alpha-carbinolamine dehydratase [Cryobacterium melibiosiphilum]
MTRSAVLLAPHDTAGQIAGSAFIHLDGALFASYTTADFASAVQLLTAVTVVAESLDHHPEVRLGYGRISFKLSSHDVNGVTKKDLLLAERIQDLADGIGAGPVRVPPSRYDIAIDCSDADAIRPFWRASLGYEEAIGSDGIELVDPRGLAPRVWFQHMEIARTDRNRIHLDVYVPTDDAEARVEAVVLAGGTLLTDEHAPDWWVLADVEGNEICICTAPN